VTRAVTGEDLAARRRRAVSQRCATLGGSGPEAPRTQCAGVGQGGLELVVLLPSTDAATVLLLCGDATGLTG